MLGLRLHDVNFQDQLPRTDLQNAKWLLFDDARDPAVVAGIFQALRVDLNRGSVEWAYFPDTFTGNILIRTDHQRDT